MKPCLTVHLIKVKETIRETQFHVTVMAGNKWSIHYGVTDISLRLKDLLIKAKSNLIIIIAQF